MDIQKNIIDLKTSATLAINELSQDLIQDGKEVFMFGLGQSPFPVPEVIVDELKKNAHQNFSLTSSLTTLSISTDERKNRLLMSIPFFLLILFSRLAPPRTFSTAPFPSDERLTTRRE